MNMLFMYGLLDCQYGMNIVSSTCDTNMLAFGERVQQLRQDVKVPISNYDSALRG
jgi:hypothetical protein